MSDDPNQHQGSAAGSAPGRRYSPLTFFHGVWFVIGGGLWVLWSWWGALLVVLVLVSAWTVSRALLSPSNVDRTRAALDGWVAELHDLHDFAEHPADNPEGELRALHALHQRGLIGTDEYERRRTEINHQIGKDAPEQ